MYSSLDRFFVEEFDIIADSVPLFSLFAHAFELPRLDGNSQFSGPLPVTLDVVLLNRLFDRFQILTSEARDHFHLIGKTTFAVSPTMCQRIVAETTITSRCPSAGLTHFNDYYAPIRMFLLRQERSPETGISGADNCEVYLNFTD